MAKAAEEAPEVEQQTPPIEAQGDITARIRAVSNWDAHIIYVYRMEPRRPNTSKNPYLVKYSEAIDAETLKMAYGSGVYQLRLLQAMKGGGSRQVDAGTVEILDENYKPVLGPLYAGWEDDPRNKPWLWASERGKPGANVGGGESDSHASGLTANDVFKMVNLILDKAKPATQDQRDALVNATISALEKGHDKSIEMILKQVDAQSPTKFVEMLGAMEKLSKPGDAVMTALLGHLTSKPADNGLTPIVTALISGQTKMLETLSTRQPEQQQQGNGLATLKDFVGLLKDSRELLAGPAVVAGEGGGADVPWYVALGNAFSQTFGPALAAAAGPLSNALAAKLMAQSGVAVPIAPTTPAALPAPTSGGSVPPAAPDDGTRSIAAQMFPHVIAAVSEGRDGADLAQSLWDLGFRPALAVLHGYEWDGTANVRKSGALLSIIQLHPEWTRSGAPIAAQAERIITQFWEKAHEILEPADGWPDPIGGPVKGKGKKT